MKRYQVPVMVEFSHEEIRPAHTIWDSDEVALILTRVWEAAMQNPTGILIKGIPADPDDPNSPPLPAQEVT